MKRSNTFNDENKLNSEQELFEPLTHNFKEYIKGFNMAELIQCVEEGKANKETRFGYPPIILAVCDDDSTEKLEYLITRLIDVNIQANNNGFTALHMVVNTNHESAVKIKMLKLLLYKEPNILIKNNDEKTPLELAISNNNTQAVRILLIHLLKKYCESNPWKVQILTALKFFSENNINIDYSIDNKDVTPLYAAMQTHDIDIIDAVIKARANVNFQNFKSDMILYETPLYFATRTGHLQIVELLLKSKVNVDIKVRDGSNALQWAVPSNSTDIMQSLLQVISNKDSQDHNGNTALHTAVQFKARDVLQTLIKAKADVNLPNNEKETPLHIAVLMRSCDELINALLEAKADVNLKDIRGKTPFEIWN